MSSTFNINSYDLRAGGGSGSSAVAADYETEADINLPGESSDTNINGCRIGVALEGPYAGDALYNSNDHQVFIDHETGLLVVSDRFTDSDDKTMKPNFAIDLNTGIATDAYGVMYDLPDRCRFVLSDGTKIVLDKIKLQDGSYGRDIAITNIARGDGKTEANGNFGTRIRYDGSGEPLTYHGSNNDGKDIEALYHSGSHIDTYHNEVGWRGSREQNVPSEDTNGDDLDFGDDEDNMGDHMPDIFVTNVFKNPAEEGMDSIAAFVNKDGNYDFGAYRAYVNRRLQHDDDNTKTYDPVGASVKAMDDERGGAWTICYGMDDEFLEKNDRLYLNATTLLKVHVNGEGFMAGGPVVADVQPVYMGSTGWSDTESAGATSAGAPSADADEPKSIFRSDAASYAAQFSAFAPNQQAALLDNTRDDDDKEQKESMFKPEAMALIRGA